ncbi:MAG: hypothetical protein KDD94_10580 [Calditrichaeota bacterium]|nr:hypothetical protein [Calditrichota bacterium]
MKTVWLDEEQRVILYRQEADETLESCILKAQKGWKGMILSRDKIKNGKVHFRDYLILSKDCTEEQAKKYRVLFKYLDDVSFNDILTAFSESIKEGRYRVTYFDEKKILNRIDQKKKNENKKRPDLRSLELIFQLS